MSKFPLILLVVTMMTSHIQSLTCPYDTCTCSPDWLPPRIYIDCTNKHLTSLPTLKSGATGNLTWSFAMSSNSIASLNSGQLPPSIQEFRSLGNPLTNIADDALDGSRDLLDKLVIMNSDLTSVPKVIGSLTSLTKLYLNYNSKLSDAGTTSYPATITDLYLNANALISLPSDAFKNLPLRIFHVDFNKIKSLNGVVFPSSLKSLYASDNEIEVISSLKFSATAELEVLALYNNPLKSIDKHAFAQLQKLTTLSLTGSRLTRLPLAVTDLPALTHLNLWNINSLVCTCAEAEVATWYQNRKGGVRIDGKCGSSQITEFLENLAPQCAASPAA